MIRGVLVVMYTVSISILPSSSSEKSPEAGLFNDFEAILMQVLVKNVISFVDHMTEFLSHLELIKIDINRYKTLQRLQKKSGKHVLKLILFDKMFILAHMQR